MTIRRLTPADATSFQRLRLSALLEAPTAFGASHEEEKDFPLAVIEARLAPRPDQGVFGVFDGEALLGLVALGRDNKAKLAHKAQIWGLYVAPEARARGMGRGLLLEALALARSVAAFRQVNLSVNAHNTRAIRLYESVGFIRFGYEPGALLVDGEWHDEVHLSLGLRPVHAGPQDINNACG